jgi:O-antigen ligase
MIVDQSRETIIELGFKGRVFLVLFIGLIFMSYVFRREIPFNFEFLIGFSGLVGVFWLVRNKLPLPSPSLLIIVGLFILYFVLSLLNTLIFHSFDEVAEGKLKILLLFVGFALFILFLSRFRLTVDSFWWFFVFASLVMNYWFYLEFQAIVIQGVSENDRFGNVYGHEVMFGIFSNSLLIIMLGGFVWAYKKHPSVMILWTILVLSNLAMVIMSQTRSAWIGWPEAVFGWGAFYLYLLSRSNHSLKFKLFVSIVPLMVLTAIFSSKPVVEVFEKRIEIAGSDISHYLNGSDYYTSLGLRLVMYESSLEMISENPVTGVGPDYFSKNFSDYSLQVIEERFGVTDSVGIENNRSDKPHSHAHNQFIMTWVQYGVLSLLTLIVIFVFLIAYFAKNINKVADEKKPIFVAGLIFSVASLLSFFPDSPLEFSRFTGHYLLFFSVLFTFANSFLREQFSKRPA